MTDTAACDGSSSCPADEHILGCFRSEAEPDTAAPKDDPMRCACEYRRGAFCLNRASGEDHLCDPCRRDGGSGHPNACRWDGVDAEIVEARPVQNRAAQIILDAGHADCASFAWSAASSRLRCACGADLGVVQ